ncbi:unnamed protein product, partial [Prorocentrum cordatum]
EREEETGSTREAKHERNYLTDSRTAASRTPALLTKARGAAVILVCRRLLQSTCSPSSRGVWGAEAENVPALHPRHGPPAHRQRGPAGHCGGSGCLMLDLSERARGETATGMAEERKGGEEFSWREQWVTWSSKLIIKKSWLTQFEVADGYKLRCKDRGSAPNFVNPTRCLGWQDEGRPGNSTDLQHARAAPLQQFVADLGT